MKQRLDVTINNQQKSEEPINHQETLSEKLESTPVKSEADNLSDTSNDERSFFGEFRGAEVNEVGEYQEPTPEQEEKFKKRVERVAEIFKQANFQWYLDGATNISLYQDKQMRDHKDLDMSVFMEDLAAVEKLLTEQGFGIFVNDETDDKKKIKMKKVLAEEIAKLDKPDLSNLSICKVDSEGNRDKKTTDPFNFVDMHIHSKDAEGNTVIFYNRATLPKEYFEPIKKQLSNGKEINLSQPMVVAYHKFHQNRPYDLIDLQKLKPNLSEKDSLVLRDIIKKEIKEIESSL
ncbi:MAG: hypothetical protein COX77_00900 [Candidatus Komeilibacteria bacterium CG_4_10_14_0_2_um_filter_37_10]|uniref:Uncharacterized protein n=1 Tax=Candidatus Komeilibacteria bacterium CG_4_10_14_0_2_um_filter_37_10 TaxID=1974470 RepID=A0A2M7VG30_9BACT|nr:MAG: hypothetical protein COX77_00900 [Candidatus Komeilibacteria bacterium CG_4_10_14_0_2_um_filter_37_10]